MNILMLNYEFPPLGGGAANETYYWLSEFSKNTKIQISFITSSVNKYKEEDFSDNIKIYYLDIGKKGNLHYQSNIDLLKYSWKAYRFCQKLKKKKKFDLIHAIFGIPCGFIAMKLKLPYIVALQGSDVPFYSERFYWLDKLFFKRLSKKIWNRADRVIANSEELKNLALQSSPNQKIDVIHNGVDIDKFKPITKGDSDFTIVSTSRLIKRKGIQYLTDAFIDFNKKYPDSRLLLAGSGDLEHFLRQKTVESNTSKKVNFFGSVPSSQIADIYRCADVFVLPSFNEGMSNSLLEAMSSGLAVIVTDVGGTKELVVNYNNGIIIRKGSVQDIFKALEQLYLNKDLLAKMKLSSRQKAEQMSWADVTGQYLDIYKEIQHPQVKVYSGNFESNILFLNKTKLLNKSIKILEIGSGSGVLAKHLLDKGVDIIGTEVLEDKINFAKDNFNVELVKITKKNLPFASDSFDIVLSFDVFEHINDSNYHLQEVRRVLKESGYYLLSTPNKWTNIPFEIIRSKGLMKWRKYHCALHNYWQIKKRFNSNGFNPEFLEVPIFNDFFSNQTEKYFGKIGLKAVKFINVDKLPIFLKTNFYIKAKNLK